MEGHGNVLSDIASGETSDSEGAILQVALWFARLFSFAVVCQ